jgi:N6-L-threonylcarbamoyladenine synthase
MRVLGIESSCDECAAAVLEDGRSLRGQVVASQVAIHAAYGGVVPELASRDHLRKVVQVVEGTLQQAGIKLSDIDGIGVTAGPGLIGSLLVGVMAAKGLAWALGRPLVGVNHLEAHLNAIRLEQPDLPWPQLGLVVSGGHTSLYRVEGVGLITLLGRTLDDAAGEAFDKVAKILALGYPGGISIEQAAQGGDPKALAFPRPMPGKNPNFSFSGLKTAAAVRVKQQGVPEGQALADFAASFQEAVVDTLVKKTVAAAQREHLSRIVVAGGVAANRRLREGMAVRAQQAGLAVHFPSVALCTDNAAMVAALAHAYLAAGRDDGLTLDADAGLGWQTA